MKHSSSVFSTLRKEAMRIDLSSFLRKSHCPRNIPEISVILLTTNQPFLEDLKNESTFSFYYSQSLHEFFRRGLNLNSFILIAPHNRSECSSFDLNQIVGNRTNVPFEILINNFEKAHELTDAVGKCYNRIKSLVSLEISVDNLTESQLKKNRINQSEIDKSTESREYRFTKRILMERLSREIGDLPEIYLAKQISKIRKL